MEDLYVAAATLRGNAGDAWLSGWIGGTWSAPQAFEEALYAYLSTWRKGIKSRRGRSYDLYHDLVVAHLEHRLPALFGRDGGAHVEIGYDALHQRCSALASAWKGAGVEPGQAVGIVLPVGIEYAVALLTAIRMGVVAAPLPPYGPSFVRRRLEVLAPEWIVTTPRLAGVLELPPKGLLPTTAPRDTGAPPLRAQAPGEEVLRLLSPFADADADPVSITAAALHASIMRDGLLVYGLTPNDVLAAPGFEALQFQPHLLLSALACGACWAEIDAADLVSDPGLGERARLSVIGINRDLRERVLARGHALFPQTARAWFRNLTELLDLDQWDLYSRALTGRELPGFNVVACAATGGVELFSQRARAMFPGLRVWPAPGRPFQLSEVAGGGLLALNDAGVYTPMEGEEPLELPLPRLLLSRQPQGFFFAGALDLGQHAQVYPREEVARVAAQHPAVRHASVVLGPGRWMNDARVVLVIFTDDARDEDGRVVPPVEVPEITSHIARELGDRFVPERVEIFPLRPRLVNGKLDEGWVRSQYLSGALSQKARSEMFILLSRIGYILAGGPPGG